MFQSMRILTFSTPAPTDLIGTSFIIQFISILGASTLILSSLLASSVLGICGLSAAGLARPIKSHCLVEIASFIAEKERKPPVTMRRREGKLLRIKEANLRKKASRWAVRALF